MESRGTEVSPREDSTSQDEPDDLTRVMGIGAVFSRRLRDAGIDRFSQLAALRPVWNESACGRRQESWPTSGRGQRSSATQLAIGDTMGPRSRGAEAADSVLFVFAVVSGKPEHVAVTFKGKYVGSNAIQEPTIV